MIGKKEIEWQGSGCGIRLDGYLIDGDFISTEEIRRYGQHFAGVGCPNCGCIIGEEIAIDELAAEWGYEDEITVEDIALEWDEWDGVKY